MDFFAHQQWARRNTRLLVVLYAVSVVLIILAVYAAAAFAFLHASEPEAAVGWWNPALFGLIAVGLTLLIGGGTLYKLVQLGKGGDVVARMLGGALISPNTADPDERRLLNVVEEMAIAAGSSVPNVYVLDEQGINAFAAGFSSGDAVIGVTRGAVKQLNRDELQGVVAHEFSHILYGDMRLNLRLMGVLHGILLIALLGYFLLRGSLFAPRGRRSSARRGSSSGGKEKLAMVLMGLALMVIGYIGVVFARLIKSAVSRQREFLADAAAVQFTRNPAGLGSALRKIAGHSMGSRITHPEAEETSHLFFSNALSSAWLGMLSTHPPLKERIRRIAPDLSDDLKPSKPARAEAVPEGISSLAGTADAGERGETATEGVTDRVGQPTGAHLAWAADVLRRIPAPLKEAAHDPDRAPLLLAAYLMQPKNPSVFAKQQEILATEAPAWAAHMDRRLSAVQELEPVFRLPLLDVVMGTLRHLDSGVLDGLQRLCDRLIEADGQVHMFEFAVQRMLTQVREQRSQPNRRGRVDYPALRPLLSRISILLAALAREGLKPDEAFAAGMRALGMQIPPMPSERACSLASISGVLSDLERASPIVKRQVMNACAACIATDGVLSAGEGDLLRAVAASLDCPLPPLHVAA